MVFDYGSQSFQTKSTEVRNRELWVNTDPDVGQPDWTDKPKSEDDWEPDWDVNEYRQLRAQSRGYVQWKKREHWDRDEKEALNVEELLERFEKEWVLSHGNEWHR